MALKSRCLDSHEILLSLRHVIVTVVHVSSDLMIWSQVFALSRTACCSFLLLAALTAADGFKDHGTGSVNLNSNSETGTQQRQVFILATTAKALIKHRSKRGWWWWREDEHEEGRRETRKNLERTCPHNCWGSWSSWSSCSSPCGNNGYRTARRYKAPSGACRDWARNNRCPGPCTRSVACNRFCNNGGTPRTGICRCKPGFYGRCCQYWVTCRFPGRPSKGTVKVDLNSSGKCNWGTVARYKCSHGYRLVGQSTRTCQTIGIWSGAIPRCEIVTCPNPEIPVNGFWISTSPTRQVGTTVTFHCHTGYRLVGHDIPTCLSNSRWSHPRPTCELFTCPHMSAPSGGNVRLPAIMKYRSVATYSCHTGYYMVGPRTRTCLASGRWDGADTKCSRISCDDLPRPLNGNVNYPSGKPPYYGQIALYSCESGYVLTGSDNRTCGGSGSRGVWSGTQPACEPVICGDPGRPDDGLRMGSVFTYRSSVTYKCLPGHFMQGVTKVTCLSSGNWSDTKPSCNACTVNHYKTGSSGATSCTRCPAHSHTAGQGSTTIKQCMCDRGFRGNPGGPCTQIRCLPLNPPVNGHVSTCNTTIDGACIVECNDGYIRSAGDGVRQCKEDGTWSGSDVVCSACPRNTYQATLTQCEPCSTHSYTTGVASVKSDCVCSTGFNRTADGLCNDVNECESGNGGCEQKCDNTVGSYLCVCDIPGFKTDPAEVTRCIEYKKCPAFPTPDNGGAVCNRILPVNTRRCQVKCNNGFDHPDSPQKFEECGPNTGWEWSFVLAGRDIPPCIEQFARGVKMKASVFYFDDLCESLTTTQRQELQKQFVAMLQENGLCQFKGQQVCNIDQVQIECGEADDFGDLLGGSGFSKRSADTDQMNRVLKISFIIEIPPEAAREVSCNSYCGMTPVESEACKKICRDKYMEEKISTVGQAGNKLKELYQSNARVGGDADPSGQNGGQTTTTTASQGPSVTEAPSQLLLSVDGRSIQPASPYVRLGAVKHECQPGTTLHDGFCMSCGRGSKWNAKTKQCDVCPRGTHTPRDGMTRCLPCPPGYTAPSPGATVCIQA